MVGLIPIYGGTQPSRPHSSCRKASQAPCAGPQRAEARKRRGNPWKAEKQMDHDLRRVDPAGGMLTHIFWYPERLGWLITLTTMSQCFNRSWIKS